MEKLISSPRAVPRNSRIFAFFNSNCEKKRQKKKNGKHRENLLTLEMAFERAYSHQLERTPSSIEHSG